MQDFQIEFGYDQLFTIEPVGRSGGIALFYMDASNVVINFSNVRMIDIEAQVEGHKVLITFVYGDPVVEYHGNVWKRMLRLNGDRDGPWLLLGDFNEIISNEEKKGGRIRADSSFLQFRNMLASCGMIYFPFVENSLSWAGRTRAERVQCRLGRAVGNED